MELIPDNSKYLIYQLAGSSEGIAHQISQFMARREYLEDKLYSPSEGFMTHFENCFPLGLGKSSNGDNPNPRGRTSPNKPNKKLALPADADRYLHIEFWPDREVKESSYLLIGSSGQCIQPIQIMHWKRLTESLGQWLGYPPTEWLIRRPHQGLSIVLVLTYKDPPFYKSSLRSDFRVAQISIPFVSSLSYDLIRQVCGGANGISWGQSTIAWV